MNKSVPRTPFSTPLSGSARETEIRLRNIFSGPKKRPPALFLALIFSVCVFCGNLVSCQVAEAGAPSPGDGSSRTGGSQTDSPQTELSSSGEEPQAATPVSPPAVEPDAARAAYVKVLEDLLYRDTTPDGEQWPPFGGEYTVGFEDMSQNTFAVADVDGDGREELVFLTRPNIYAGYRGWILDYDQGAGSVRVQFEGFPSLTFYSNGALAEDDSHAQRSWTSEFWPHSLFRYLPETDSYELAGHLDAWEKVISDINPGSLPPFPTEKDISGAGILYYITQAEDLGPSFTGYRKEAVDQSVYLEWLEPILGDSQPLELEYLPLTEENIAQLKEAPLT